MLFIKNFQKKLASFCLFGWSIIEQDIVQFWERKTLKKECYKTDLVVIAKKCELTGNFLFGENQTRV